jgi:putative transposase
VIGEVSCSLTWAESQRNTSQRCCDPVASKIEDHVHLLLKIHLTFAIADTIKLSKGNSSKWINENRKISARFEWQRGYGAFCVSESMSDTVKRYIDNQEEHHRTQSFEDEYFAFLRKHKTEFDERYVFDEEMIG